VDLRTVLSAVESWSAEDRLRLIEEVWESLEADPEAARLTESQKHDLQRRLDTYRGDPGAGSPWEEVKARLRGAGR
jgi:putative addiction module component (TIGR02574 family)